MTPPAATAAATRTGRVAVPRAPRRVSGPARRPAAPPRAAWVDVATRVADARLLDRLIRGRAWIALVGALLIGLVFVQVSMLRLNTAIGADVTSAAKLERANQGLRNQLAELGAGDRIETAANGLGMVMPAAGQVHYLRAGVATAATAAKSISAPAPVAQLPVAAAATGTVAPTLSTAGATGTVGANGVAVTPAATDTAPATTVPATTATTAAPAAATTAQAAPQTTAPTQQAPPATQSPPAQTGGAAPAP